jgi:hypothetical protein
MLGSESADPNAVFNGLSSPRGGADATQATLATAVTDETLLSTREAAAFLGVRPRTLEHWRLVGGGPPFVRVGRRLVRYRLGALRAFLGEPLLNTALG